MASSLLAAVHNAVVGAAEAIPEGEATGAQAPNSTRKDEAMSRDDAPAGGDQKSGISQAEHEAAVKSAADTARSEGAKAATDRLVAALGAEGVKGDAQRMAAALDLAVKSPGMSGEDVASFVVANVALTPQGTGSKSYEQGRLAASGLAQPGAAGGGSRKATIDTSGIYAARRKQSQEG